MTQGYFAANAGQKSQQSVKSALFFQEDEEDLDISGYAACFCLTSACCEWFIALPLIRKIEVARSCGRGRPRTAGWNEGRRSNIVDIHSRWE